MYGTKQAPAIWHKAVRDWLLEQGLKPTQPEDPRVFIERDGDDFFFVGVHVDDILMVTTQSREPYVPKEHRFLATDA